MEIDKITAELLETAFKQWHQAQEPPAELLELDLLRSPHPSSGAERAIQLYDYLAKLVMQQLVLNRQAEAFDEHGCLLLQRQVLLADLAHDFSVGNANLESWSMLYHRYPAPLPLSIQELAKGANVEERQIRRRLELGLRLLVDLVRRAEKATHERQQVSWRRRHLPPAEYAKLFGVEQSLDNLAARVSDPAQASFISLEGVGGIGKTTLARAVADRLAVQTHFTDILWVQAKPQQIDERGAVKALPGPAMTIERVLLHLAAQLGLAECTGADISEIQMRLRAIWANHPYLIIMDNLETIADTNKLLLILHAIAGQSRFLLTSRHTLRYYAFVQTFNVPELSFQESLAFMRYEIQRKQGRCSLTVAALTQIYETIGGLPLAIQLVTAQIGRLSLHTILDGLRQACPQMPASMYIYIYRQTWQLLSNVARHLLLALLFLAPAGEDVDGVAHLLTYPESEVQQAFVELADCSLVRMSGEIEHPHYKLDRLTHTFL